MAIKSNFAIGGLFIFDEIEKLLIRKPLCGKLPLHLSKIKDL